MLMGMLNLTHSLKSADHIGGNATVHEAEASNICPCIIQKKMK